MRKKVCIQILVMVFLSTGILSAQTIDLSEIALYYQNHTYLYIEKADDWLAAQALCKKAGGYLVVLGNDIENRKIADKFPMPIWIGLSDYKT